MNLGNNCVSKNFICELKEVGWLGNQYFFYLINIAASALDEQSGYFKDYGYEQLLREHRM